MAPRVTIRHLSYFSFTSVNQQSTSRLIKCSYLFTSVLIWDGVKILGQITITITITTTFLTPNGYQLPTLVLVPWKASPSNQLCLFYKPCSTAINQLWVDSNPALKDDVCDSMDDIVYLITTRLLMNANQFNRDIWSYWDHRIEHARIPPKRSKPRIQINLVDGGPI